MMNNMAPAGKAPGTTFNLELIDRLESIAKSQTNGSRYPRCGNTMQGDLHTHALSRRASIIICDECGIKESLEDFGLLSARPLKDWAVFDKKDL